MSEDETGFWIQEIPNPLGIAHNVLNGHITGIYGIMDVMMLTGDQGYRYIVNKAIDAVRDQIRNFDAGTTSYYDMKASPGKKRKLAPLGGYNRLHVRQLMRLYEIDDDPVFKEIADRFKSYEDAHAKSKSVGAQ